MLLVMVQAEQSNSKHSFQVNAASLMRRTAEVHEHGMNQFHQNMFEVLDHCKSKCPKGCENLDDSFKKKCRKCAECHGINPSNQLFQREFKVDKKCRDSCDETKCRGPKDAHKAGCRKCAECHGVKFSDSDALVETQPLGQPDESTEGDDSDGAPKTNNDAGTEDDNDQ